MTDLSPKVILAVLWRRKWWILAPALLGAGAAALIVEHLPAVYRASTLVLVEPPTVPEGYVKTTVTTSMQERLKTIEQQITNRNKLERIVTELKLHQDLLQAGKMGEATARVRRALTLQVQGNRVFRIFFAGSDPETVAAVANFVTELFIEENLRLRENQAEGTTAFLSRQLDELKRELETQEGKIARFKRQHVGELPEQRESNMRALEALQAKIAVNIDALDKAETRKLYIQREMMRYQETGEPAPTRPATAELERARSELARLRARYTEEHPEVVRAREELERLQKEYLNMPREISAEPRRLRQDPLVSNELRAIELEIQSLKGEQQRIQDDIARYQVRLDNTPHVETELLNLTRDYDNIRGSYDRLLAKRLDAQLAEDLEQERQSEQFTILERAVPPERPYAPDRKLLLVAGIGLGSLVGLALAFLRQGTDQSYNDAETLQEAFPGVPLLGVVPVLTRDKGRPLREAQR